MSRDNAAPEDQEREEYRRRDEVTDEQSVASRAEGRPPEEGSSADPHAQAETILQDSEARVAERSARSTPED